MTCTYSRRHGRTCSGHRRLFPWLLQQGVDARHKAGYDAIDVYSPRLIAWILPNRRTAMSVRPRRSVLYMPGSNARAIEKARTLPADAVILDLEDSVAPEAKAHARQQVLDAVRAGGFAPREVVVRINALETPWWIEDLNAVARAKPDAVLVPKVSTPQHLADIAERMVDISADHHIRVWVMIETPLAVLNAGL